MIFYLHFLFVSFLVQNLAWEEEKNQGPLRSLKFLFSAISWDWDTFLCILFKNGNGISNIARFDRTQKIFCQSDEVKYLLPRERSRQRSPSNMFVFCILYHVVRILYSYLFYNCLYYAKNLPMKFYIPFFIVLFCVFTPQRGAGSGPLWHLCIKYLVFVSYCMYFIFWYLSFTK